MITDRIDRYFLFGKRYKLCILYEKYLAKNKILCIQDVTMPKQCLFKNWIKRYFDEIIKRKNSEMK